MRHLGYRRYPGNPALCEFCIGKLNKAGVQGAEIPVTLLSADIRGSTGIGKRLSPGAFRTHLDRFYRISSKAILDHDGLVDKFVSDEAIGLFFMGISGARHTAAAIAAARQLLDEVGRPDASDDGAFPVGAAVHTGDAFVDTTGTDGAVSDFTALGDVVNTRARLVSEAAAGELLVSEMAAEAAGLDAEQTERRTIPVRGRSEPITVVSLTIGQGSSTANVG